MRWRGTALAALLCLPGAAMAQREKSAAYDPGTVYSVAFAGAATSNDIFAGLAQQRALLLASVAADIMVHRGRHTRYQWEFELLPAGFLRDPHEIVDQTITLPGQPPVSSHIDELPFRPCSSFTYSGPYYVTMNGVITAQGTILYSQACSQQWTYVGGASPLGQRVSFRPNHRIQPYVIANAGFLAAPRSIPMDGAARFNFTAEIGGGVTVYRNARNAVAFDVRYHHLSNGGRAEENPAVENWLLRLTYRMGR